MFLNKYLARKFKPIMSIYKSFTIIFLSLIITSCGSSSSQKKNDFAIKTNALKGNLSISDTLNLTIINKKSFTIDSVSYTLNGGKIEKNHILINHKLGKHEIEATIYLKDETQKAKTSVTILNNEAPKIYTFNIINEYPHDITSYTQGLEFYEDFIYESTGQYKESKLRKIVYKTGEVLKNINLSDEYFGEGLTILNGKLYQLTWQENTGFVYDLERLERLSTFKYGASKEGWGLCNDGETIFKSDGTEKIWTLNPETLEEQDYIQVFTNKGKIGRINELEWIDGYIYANIYGKNGVAIINPVNGAVVGVVDFSPLRKKVTQHPKLDVLNGLAFNTKTETLFVTGKLWDKLFEVEIIK